MFIRSKREREVLGPDPKPKAYPKSLALPRPRRLVRPQVHLNLTAAVLFCAARYQALSYHKPLSSTMLSRQVAVAGARVGATRGFSVLTAAEEFPG